MDSDAKLVLDTWPTFSWQAVAEHKNKAFIYPSPEPRIPYNNCHILLLRTPSYLRRTMNTTRLAKSPLSLTAVPQNAPTPFLGYLVKLSDRILFISGICAATIPLAYYIICYYYQEIEKATCRKRNSDLIIILGSILFVMYPVNIALRYLALRRTQRADQ
ncbi:hypothetical protein BDV23DRAFT_161916 [Aspergillus alliaceus]|uniref:Uncharacterized protein n=1 Tax=Petromyces alliaceus TaxID=209559 RepID=A0A5N7BZ22_PETAA|nr:hypothetical protein BDV23DRAFT_161916 [Aspergillus alliaceus]